MYRFMNKYLVLRTIHQICLHKIKNFPIASKIASNHMYLDNFLGSATSIESAKSLIEDLIMLFNAFGFKLRKLSSNETNAISHLPESLKASSNHQSLNPDSSQRILGLEWNPKSDTLRVQVNEEISVKTNRDLLSVITQFFNPLGILAHQLYC